MYSSDTSRLGMQVSKIKRDKDKLKKLITLEEAKKKIMDGIKDGTINTVDNR